MDEEQINEVAHLLNDAQEILLDYNKTLPGWADLDVSEWNQTPIGRAIHRIQSALELIVE